MSPLQPTENGASAHAPLERDAELAALAAALSGAAGGAGRLVTIEGPAGIGKSRLLDETARLAERASVRVLRGQATELERSFAFGIALQVFEPAVAGLDGPAREAALRGAAGLASPLLSAGAGPAPAGLPGEPHDFSIIHGLYWLAANLAEETPLALLVDDAQWADEPSLRLLSYLAQRVDELPITLVVAMRPGEPGAHQELLDGLTAHRGAGALRPAPLSAAAIAALAGVALGDRPDPAFCDALLRMTGGNPFLLRELLAAAAAEDIRPTATGATRVIDLAPEGVLRAVAARLAAVDDDAAALARAVAVLGDEAKLRHAAELAGLSPERAAEAADQLAAAEILRPGEPLGFRHALTAAAVDARLPRAARAEAHLRAAALLRAEGAAPERLATHLVPAPATGEPWIVATLRASAARAVTLGAPQLAVVHLRRALDEPPPPAERAAVLAELGRAEATVGAPTAAERLAAAAELTTDPAERAHVLRELARTRVSAGDHAGARAAYASALGELNGADPELIAHLQAEELVVAALDPARSPHADAAAVQAILHHDRVGATASGRALLATLAVHELYAGAPRDRVLALAERALAGGALMDDEGADAGSLYGVVLALFVAEELSRADELLTRLMTSARKRGSVMGLASGAYSRGWTRLIAGRVSDALDDAQQAVDAGRHGWRQFLPGAFGLLTHALLDAGELEQAEKQLAEAESIEGPEQVTTIQVLDARGRIHASRGRFAQAAKDFLAAGEMAGAQRNPLLFATWRSNAGLALARTGERDQARELVEAELELAHAFGAPRGMAVAQRALGVIEGGQLGLEMLEESVRVLDDSEAKLERGRSLLEYGGALRRAGKRTDAGRVLGEALEIARAGGAGELERRASEELAVAGARAGRAARRGREALSPSERRVAQLAASGMSNREIAEELFVTRKAVEWHLRNAYVKLGISSRRDLPDALKIPAD